MSNYLGADLPSKQDYAKTLNNAKPEQVFYLKQFTIGSPNASGTATRPAYGQLFPRGTFR